MHTFVQSIELNAAQDEAWRLLSTVSAWAEWLPTVSEVQPLDEAAIAVGHRYRLRQPRLQPALWRVTELNAPHNFAWESRALGMLSVADHRLEPLGPGRLRLTLSITMRGLLTPLVRRVYGALIDDYMAQEAAALKRRLEGVGSGL